MTSRHVLGSMLVSIVPRRALLSVARGSSRAQRSSACANRRYATQQNHGKREKYFSPVAHTWLTETPGAISPDDILSSLPPLPSTDTAPDLVPILLVTPSFAHWVDTADPFVHKLLNRLHANVPKLSHRYAVAAVIDKLPNNSTQPGGSIPEGNDHPAGEWLESEGLSLLVVQRDNVQGQAAPPRRIKGPAGDEPDLVISVRDSETSHSRGTAHEIGLRLANTVFVNGKESTMFGMRWAYDETTGAYTLDKSADLTRCSVTSISTPANPGLTLPLEPVTQRRRVVTSMGNILRQVTKSIDPTSLEPMPASSELEKELPRYIEEHDIVDQRVSVWALVEKPDVVVADYNSSTQDRLIQSLRQGGKLHRVMSGGGGWGKKQGLLSLDPEVSFSATARRDELVRLDQLFDPDADAPLEMPSFLTKGMVGDDLSLLSQVATAGDFIQFFAGVEPEHLHKDVANDTSMHGGVAYHFGVVSDAEEVDAQNMNEEKRDLVMVPNTFGALSKKAITYSQPVTQRGEISSSSTKLDIPGCRVILSPVQ